MTTPMTDDRLAVMRSYVDIEPQQKLATVEYIRELLDEVARLRDERKGLVEALKALLPFVIDEWEGTRECLMSSCHRPMDNHSETCPIGQAERALKAAGEPTP